MIYEIEFSRTSLRSFRRLPRKEQRRLATRIDRLATNPRPRGMKKMAGNDDLYRIRCGDYRVIYTIEDDMLRILVVGLGHRRDVYS